MMSVNIESRSLVVLFLIVTNQPNRFGFRRKVPRAYLTTSYSMTNLIVVFGGGTATNCLVQVFAELSPSISYVLPVLDNGGSTSEIMRVIGGPAVGDVRSRLTRLIPDENKGLKLLLSHRLCNDPLQASIEWNQIIEGTHILWLDVNSSTKEIVRSFLLHVHVELMKRLKLTASGDSGKKFHFELASVGNLLLTGIRLFIGSLDSAVELFAKVTEINKGFRVLPCINTNFSYHIGAILSDGSIIRGQSQISHPSELDSSSRRPKVSGDVYMMNPLFASAEEGEDMCEFLDEESGSVPMYTHPELKKSQLHFRKTEHVMPLVHPIQRIFYISPFGEEICPSAHAKVLASIQESRMLVFSIGSLMTSIVPILILKGVGGLIATNMIPTRPQVLLLNGRNDRETNGMSAIDYVNTISLLANYSRQKSGQPILKDPRSFVTHLLYMHNPEIAVDIASIEAMGIKCLEIKRAESSYPEYDPKDLRVKLKSLGENPENTISHTTS